MGDNNAFKVLECIAFVAALYGENIILIQFIPSIIDLVSLLSTLNSDIKCRYMFFLILECALGIKSTFSSSILVFQLYLLICLHISRDGGREVGE